MTLAFVRIEDIGNPTKERVVLRATAAVDIGGYALFRCQSLNEKSVSSGPVLNAFWFENRAIKANDWVVVYTKPGQTSEKKGDNNITSYFYYWGLSGNLWTSQTAAVLVRTPSWQIGQRFS